MKFPAPTTFSRLAMALLVAGAATVAIAQENPHRGQGEPKQSEQPRRQNGPSGSGVLRLLPPDSVTRHAIDTTSGRLDYTATAGTLSLYDQSGERTAAIFYTAYVKQGEQSANRPVTFVFNGGPGAASAYLHLGLVGPRIVEFGETGRDGSGARLQDNPSTWLAFTDLVLIDPVGSGWSKAAKPDGANAFWSVRRDAESLAKVIALYVANNAR